MYPMYLSLHYVLLFPIGQLEWHKRMFCVNAPDAPVAPAAANDKNPLNNNEKAAKICYSNGVVLLLSFSPLI